MSIGFISSLCELNKQRDIKCKATDTPWYQPQQQQLPEEMEGVEVVVVVAVVEVVVVVLHSGLKWGSGGGYPKSGPKLNFNGSGAS